MSETQTVLQSSKDEDAQQNNAQNDDRRGSQPNNDNRRGSQQANTQSPIKSILSRAASLTQRSQKSNRNSVSEKGVEENIGNNATSAAGPGDEPISSILDKSRFIDDGLHPGRIIAEVIESPVHKRNPPSDVNPQQSQNSPTRQGKGQQILFQENGHTISVRIEGKFCTYNYNESYSFSLIKRLMFDLLVLYSICYLPFKIS